MWKLIGIFTLILRLSIQAPLDESFHEVSLNVEQKDHIHDYMVYFECFLMEVKSSKDQVIVTSSDLSINKLKSLYKDISLHIVGNLNYPEYFPKDLGKFLNGITTFGYKETPLKYIIRDDFKYMASDLEMVNLADNEIEEIPFDTFYDLIKLVYLDVRDNKIKRLAPNMFIKLPNFDALFIKSNQLSELHPDLFKDCPKFCVLYAEFNNIEEFHKDLFQNNPNMSVVAMRHNKIKNIPIDFTRFSNLHIADFTHNGGTCDTIYTLNRSYVEYYTDEDQTMRIKTLPDFQKKVEETCRG